MLAMVKSRTVAAEMLAAPRRAPPRSAARPRRAERCLAMYVVFVFWFYRYALSNLRTVAV
jgi:hypothetical protein